MHSRHQELIQEYSSVRISHQSFSAPYVCDGEMDDGIVVAIDDVKILVVRRNSLGHWIDAARIIGGLRNRDQCTGMSVGFVNEDLARSTFRVRDEDEINGPCITTRGNKQTRA